MPLGYVNDASIGVTEQTNAFFVADDASLRHSIDSACNG
jgi:hypothetical protein